MEYAMGNFKINGLISFFIVRYMEYGMDIHECNKKYSTLIDIARLTQETRVIKNVDQVFLLD